MAQFSQKIEEIKSKYISELEKKQNEIDKLNQTMTRQNKNIINLQNKLEKQEKNKDKYIAVLRKTMLLSKEEVGKFNENEAQLRIKLEEAETKLLKQENAWQDTMRNAQNEKTEILKKLSHSESEISKYKAQIENLKFEKKNLGEKNSELDAEIRELNLKVKTQKMMISNEARLVEELKKGAQKNEMLGKSQIKELGAAQRELGRMEKENKDLVKKVSKLEKKKREQDQLIQDYESELTLRNDDVVKLKEEIKKSKSEHIIEELRNSVHYLKRENARLASNAEQLKEMIGKYKIVGTRFFYIISIFL